MLKLKLQHFGYLKGRADSLEKTLMLGKIEGRRRRGQQRLRWLDGITDPINTSLSKLQEIVEDRMGSDMGAPIQPQTPGRGDQGREVLNQST